MVEGARLESEYTAKPYRGFESHPLRQFFDFRYSRFDKNQRKSSDLTAGLSIIVHCRPPKATLLCGRKRGVERWAS